MKRMMTTLVVIAFFAVASMAMAGTASANEGPGEHCHRDQITTIIGSLGNDILPGTRCDNYIYGLRGADTLIGNTGNDHLFGGRGNDLLRGVDGYADVLNCGLGGNDHARGDQLDIFEGCEHVLRFFVQPVFDPHRR